MNLLPTAARLAAHPHRDVPGHEVRDRLGEHEMLVWLRRAHRIGGHGDEFAAGGARQDGHARFRGAGADGERPDGLLALEGGDDVGHDGWGAVVEGVARAEGLAEGEVAGRAGRHDVVAGGDGELDRVAADAGGAAPDEHDFLLAFRVGRFRSWESKVQLIVLE